ncbi:MAG: molybdopterin-dependent oxidoreductase [Proteobacteria bacterium]|nr:molybdopterin-dependent oxidoreductase [Pseudomonadota bacterium]
MEIIKTDCALCVNCCGLDCYVEDGKLVKVEGMKEHPASHGLLCSKGEKLIEYQYSPDRILYPQKKLPDGTWQRITWDEAYDTIGSKLLQIKEEFGPEALALYCGSVAVEHFEASAFLQRFKAAYGTPNFISVEGGCFRSRILSRQMTFGRYTVPDELEYTKLAVVWGHNPEESMKPLGQKMRDLVEAGKLELIVIDPKKIPLADIGMYLQPRPGTDLALMLAMAHVMITENIYAREFIEEWGHGFDKFKEHVKQYPPEKVAEICDIPAIEIKRVARKMAATKGMAVYQGTASLDRQITNVQNHRMIGILMALTGNIDVPGGWIPFLPFFTTDLRLPVDDAKKPMGAEEFPLFYELWGRQVPYGQSMVMSKQVLTEKPYPIKALISSAGNPVVTLPDPNKFKEALKKLDLFVVIDLYMNETAELADIVLPACTFLETTAMGSYTVQGNYGLPFVMLRRKVVEPMGECKTDWIIWSELGRKMGMGEHFPWTTDEEMLDMLFQPSGFTFDHFNSQPNGFMYRSKLITTTPQKFRTPSGKIEIYSDTLAELGHDPMPTFIEPTESPVSTPDLAREYPLILMTGSRVEPFIHTQLRQISSLRAIIPEAAADINPSTADKFGVRDNEPVKISTPVGSIKMKVKYNDGMKLGVISIPHGWSEANACELVNGEHLDPIMGYPEDKAILCKVERI